jgi:adenylate kinase
MVLVAISGVPGSGKSTLANALASGGQEVIDIHKVVLEYNFIQGHDEERDSIDIDMQALTNFVLALEGKDTKTIFLEGHVSHLLPLDIIIILRCHPDVLRQRLEARDWSEEKIRENLEAEAMAVISQEAKDSGMVLYEIDVSDIKVEDILRNVELILAGGDDAEQFLPGKVDYFQEIMKWY